MSKERIGLGVLGLGCVVLFGYSMQLRAQIADLQQAVQDADPVRVAAAADEAHSAGAMEARGPRTGPSAIQRAPEHPSDESRDGQANAPVEVYERGRPQRHERRQTDWAAMRSEMETQTIDTVEAFATQAAWSPEVTDEVLDLLLSGGDEIAAVWSGMHEGDTTHYRAGKETHAIRAAIGEEITALVGEEEYEALDEQLWESRREAWRRAHRAE